MHVWVPWNIPIAILLLWEYYPSVMATRCKRHGTFIRHTFLLDSQVALLCYIRNMLGLCQSKGIGDDWMFHVMYIYIYICRLDSIHTFRYSSPHKVWKIMEVFSIRNLSVHRRVRRTSKASRTTLPTGWRVPCRV